MWDAAILMSTFPVASLRGTIIVQKIKNSQCILVISLRYDKERQLTMWLHWFTQFTLTTSIPSWDLVHGTMNIPFIGEMCLCYINFDNTSSMIVSNVHSVVGDVRIHMNRLIVHCRVRWGPFYDWSNVGRVNWFIDVNTFRWRKATCGRPDKIASDFMQKQIHANNSEKIKLML